MFVHRIVRESGSLVAALGGLDCIMFAAGIGENDPATRSEVAEDPPGTRRAIATA